MHQEIGRIEAIWLKRMRRGPMDPVARAEAVAGKGLLGNANQGGRRQVTILDVDAWRRAIDGLGVEIDPSVRRANVLVRGLNLSHSRGRILRLGGCRLRIFNETRPCERMDESFPGLKAALQPEWGGGVFGEVLESGTLRVGDGVQWDDTPRGEVAEGPIAPFTEK